MSETPSSTSSGKARIALFIIAIIAIGWLIFRPFQEDGPGKKALAIREEMLSQQARAENAYAPSYAADTYNTALETARQGEQEYEQGRYTAAKLSFEAAAEYFGRAIREAADSQNTPVATEEGSQQKQLTLRSEAEMRNLKAQAVDARAPALARETFEAAQQKEDQAGKAFEAEDYLESESSYENAGELFKRARDEAQAEALKATTNLGEIRRTVESQKKQMLEEKRAALRAGSETMATGLFERAQEKERAGGQYFQAGTRDGYLAAQKAYADAKDGYRKAGESAKAKALEAEMERRRTAAAAERAKADNELREESDNARAAMDEVKRRAVGNPSEKAANDVYQKATGKEADGERAYRAGDYLNATESFLAAKALYVQASEEIARRLETRAGEAAEEAQMKAAEREIKSVISRFERGLENSELSTLVALRENEILWEDFFRGVKDISVRIELRNEKINLEKGTAQVSFTGYISYYLKSKRVTEKFNFSRDWELVLAGREWRVVSSRAY